MEIATRVATCPKCPRRLLPGIALLLLCVATPGHAVSWYFVHGSGTGPATPESIALDPAAHCEAKFAPGQPLAGKKHQLTDYWQFSTPIKGCFWCYYSNDPNCKLYETREPGQGPCQGCNAAAYYWGRQVPCELSLGLSGGGDVQPGNKRSLSVQIQCSGSAANAVPVQISSNVRAGQASMTEAILQKVSGEAANCTTGPVMQCTTDADGVINFEFVAPLEVLTKDVLHDVNALCTNPKYPCNIPQPEAVTVKGCPISLTLSAPKHEVEPLDILEGLKVKATDCNGTPVNELQLVIGNTWKQETGGHMHGLANDPLRIGTIVGTTCTAMDPNGNSLPAPQALCKTDAAGEVPFSFKAPAPAGTHEIRAECAGENENCGDSPSQSVSVKVPNLVQASGQHFDYTGATSVHPVNNHAVREDALGKLRLLAQQYYELHAENLCLNDASLEWGGLFDVGCVKGADQQCIVPWTHNPWNTPHSEHRCGSVVDVKGNKPPASPDAEQKCHTLPPWLTEELKILADHLEIYVIPEATNKPNGHYHLRLLSNNHAEKPGVTCEQLMPPSP